MRDFTHDIEARLEGAYKQGASKKFGYEDITQASQKQVSMGGDSMSKHEDRMLSKIQSQAMSYLGAGDPNRTSSSVVSIPAANLSSTNKMLPPMLKSAVDTLSITNLGAPALRVKP